MRKETGLKTEKLTMEDAYVVYKRDMIKENDP